MLLTFAALTLLFWLGAAGLMMRGNRRMRKLAAIDPAPPGRTEWPKISIVIAARNEGHTVGAAVPTMLQLDYPAIELIAVNDRSEDDTGAVLDKLAATDARLQVVHVRELLPGWIGKTHAMHQGAARARGEWILFTDADVHFHPQTLRRALVAAETDRLDLLAAVPQLNEHGHLLGACVNAFSFLFTVGIQPWRIPDPRSRAHGAVGAFTFVRAARYREFGGHAPVRLRPDDDVKLGKLFKLRGGRCELAHGAGLLSVSWYATVGEMIRGLTKNSYAGTDYRPWLPPFGAALLVGLMLWPVAALGATSGLVWWCNAAAVAIFLWLGCDQTRFTGGRWWHGLLLPVGIAVFSYILLRSMIVTHWQGGVIWRGTFYPLAELKANRV